MMEMGIEEVHKKKQKEEEEETHIPMEIVKEILDRLPLKTLARFKCASKLWSSLINPIIDRRLLKELNRRICIFIETKVSLKALINEVKEPVHVNELCIYRDRFKAKLDHMLSILDLDEDIDRSLNCEWQDVVSELRDCVVDFVREADEFFRDRDALVVAAAQEDVGDA